MTKQHKPAAINKLAEMLEDGKYYQLEVLGQTFDTTSGVVHSMLMCLSRRDGWSVSPCNKIPYSRRHGLTRGRAKDEPYDHDVYEPDWERTSYLVRRPTMCI